MGKMKDYYEITQLLHWLSDEALSVMLMIEDDAFLSTIIRNELEARGHAQDRP